MDQPWARRFYSSRAWRECRQGYGKSRGWLCENCLKQGRFTAGTQVHHKQKLTPETVNDPAVALSWSNLELLCRECHELMHSNVRSRRYDVDEDGRISPRS